jgi:hypothetical protein
MEIYRGIVVAMQAVFSRSSGPPVNLPIPGNFQHVTASYGASTNDSYVGVNGPGVTVTLPIGGGCSVGKILIIADESGQASTNPAYSISVATQGGDTLGGQTYTSGTVLVAINWGSIYLVWTGIGWIIASANFSEYVPNREPYMTPSTANSYFIQTWISSVTAPRSQAYWAKPASQFPVYSNVATLNRNYFGSVLLTNGKMILVPGGSTLTVGQFNPVTGLYSELNAGPQGTSNIFQGGVLAPSGRVVFIPYTSPNIQAYVDESQSIVNSFKHNVPTPAFSGGVLDPLGNVVMIPASITSNIGTYNAESNLYSNVVRIFADGTFSGGVLLTNGNVVLVANTNANICQFNPFLGTVSNSFTVGASGTAKFSGGVLAPNGNVIMVPMSSGVANVGVFNPTALTFSNIITNTGLNSFSGGCLNPLGKIIMAPYNSANIGVVDPATLTYSNVQFAGGSFAGANILQDGRVMFTPRSSNIGILSTIARPPEDFCLSPFFNKF